MKLTKAKRRALANIGLEASYNYGWEGASVLRNPVEIRFLDEINQAESHIETLVEKGLIKYSDSSKLTIELTRTGIPLLSIDFDKHYDSTWSQRLQLADNNRSGISERASKASKKKLALAATIKDIPSAPLISPQQWV